MAEFGDWTSFGILLPDMRRRGPVVSFGKIIINLLFVLTKSWMLSVQNVQKELTVGDFVWTPSLISLTHALLYKIYH